MRRYDSAGACGKWNLTLIEDLRSDTDFIRTVDELFSEVVGQYTSGECVTSDGLSLENVKIVLGTTIDLCFRLDFLDTPHGYGMAPARFSVTTAATRHNCTLATLCCGLHEPDGNFWYPKTRRIPNVVMPDVRPIELTLHLPFVIAVRFRPRRGLTRMDNNNPYAASQPSGDVPNQHLAYGYPRRSMRFWRIEQLKAEMRAQPLSERESLPYLVVYVALFSLVSGFPNLNFNLLDALETSLSVLIAVVGTILIYRQNGGVNGQFFLQRYFAIGFVVAIRCLVAIVVAMFGLIIVLDLLGVLTDETSWYDLIFIVAAEMLLYWRIA